MIVTETKIKTPVISFLFQDKNGCSVSPRLVNLSAEGTTKTQVAASLPLLLTVQLFPPPNTVDVGYQ